MFGSKDVPSEITDAVFEDDDQSSFEIWILKLLLYSFLVGVVAFVGYVVTWYVLYGYYSCLQWYDQSPLVQQILNLFGR